MPLCRASSGYLIPHTICGRSYILRRACGVEIHVNMLVQDFADLDYLCLFSPLHFRLLLIDTCPPSALLLIFFTHFCLAISVFVSHSAPLISYLFLFFYSNPQYLFSLSLFQTHSNTHLSRISPPFSVSLFHSLCSCVTSLSLCLYLAPFSLDSSLLRRPFLLTFTFSFHLFILVSLFTNLCSFSIS